MHNGELQGYNIKVAYYLRNKRGKKVLHGNRKTEFIGFIPCNFQTYITHKIPFIT